MYDLQKNIDKILFVTKQRGLSVDQMLKRAELSPSIIANMKRGQKPSVDKIQAISEYLNCSVDYLLGRTDNPNINIFSCYRTYTDNLNKSIVIDKLDIIKLTNFGFVCLNDDNETINYLYKDIGKSVFLTENEVISFIWSERKMKNE